MSEKFLGKRHLNQHLRVSIQQLTLARQGHSLDENFKDQRLKQLSFTSKSQQFERAPSYKPYQSRATQILPHLNSSFNVYTGFNKHYHSQSSTSEQPLFTSSFYVLKTDTDPKIEHARRSHISVQEDALTDQKCPISVIANFLADKIIQNRKIEKQDEPTLDDEIQFEKQRSQKSELPQVEVIEKKEIIIPKSQGLGANYREKLMKTRQSHKLWNENFTKMYDNYDLSIHKVIYPNKMPPNYQEQLQKYGITGGYDKIEPAYIDVNPRDINSLSLDHKNRKIIKTSQKIQFQSYEDELMHLINRFEFQNLTEEQLNFLNNFQQIMAQVKSQKQVELSASFKGQSLDQMQSTIKSQLSPLRKDHALSLLEKGKISNIVGLLKYFQQDTLKDINYQIQKKHIQTALAKKQKNDKKMNNRFSPKLKNEDELETRSADSCSKNDNKEKLMSEYQSIEEQKNMQIVQMKRLFNEPEQVTAEAKKGWGIASQSIKIQQQQQKQQLEFQNNIKKGLDSALKNQLLMVQKKAQIKKKENEFWQAGHPPKMIKNRATRIQIKRALHQQELMSMPNRNESKILVNILTKDDETLKQELEDTKIPLSQAQKLYKTMVKNKKKMKKLNGE